MLMVTLETGAGRGCGFDRSAQPFAQAQGVGGIGRGQGGDELFAAIAGQQIVAPLQAAIEDAGDGTQAPITFRMAVGVVQPFEVVDVDHQYRQALALAARAAVGPIQRLIEAAPVAQSGQRIAPRQRFQFIALALDLDLAQHAAQRIAEQGADEADRGQGRLQARDQKRHQHQQQGQHQWYAGIDDPPQAAGYLHCRAATMAARQDGQQHEQSTDQQVAPIAVGHLRLIGIDVEGQQEVAQRVDRQRPEKSRRPGSSSARKRISAKQNTRLFCTPLMVFRHCVHKAVFSGAIARACR